MCIIRSFVLDTYYSVNTLNYNKATFLLSAVELKQLPADEGSEVAIIGRSNAGKSSAINTITSIKGLARTSKTPGRTQAINVFPIDSHNRLIDLPGYGYTKAPIMVSQRWMDKVNEYLETRACLRGLILVMDIRHPLKEQDQRLIDWCVGCKLPLHIMLTKTDKLKRAKAQNTLQEVKKALEEKKYKISVQLFSSLEHIGIEEIHEQLDSWFNQDTHGKK
ncbi:MAG: YihA family ribosome biogenesis GTP-binding protein [Gammaproteobacteria bacterium]|nr:YihA family ribosome biogenesis GTP-binding protein [Gammaproteobacteria bacterium]